MTLRRPSLSAMERSGCADAHSSSQERAARVALVLALLCGCFSAGCEAVLTDIQKSFPYIGDSLHLTTWQQATFLNFPAVYWTGQITQACPSAGFLGYQGVSCQPVGSGGQEVVTEVDLSYSNLPPGYPKLETNSTLGVNYQIVGCLYLNKLNLDGNAISGPMPPQLFLAPSLLKLIISNNEISGVLPSEWCSLGLTCLNVANNSMEGPIPACFRHIPCVDFENSGLNFTRGVDCDNTTKVSSCAPPASIQNPTTTATSSLGVGAVIGIVVGCLTFFAMLAALTVFLIRLRERQAKEEERRRLAEDIETQISTRHFGTLRRYSAESLSSAANGFDEDNLLGEGGFSRVYKGTLEDGKVVAIKKIKEERKDGELEFLNEVELISRAVHRNLMHCEGFCVEAGQCMLVLPFYANGSVASRTHGKQGDPLPWASRQKIARGAAEGVAYLHTDCNPKLIHRDIKADNVLLDEQDEAIIADFGLAKALDVKETHRTTAVKGTIGHIAPEYFVSGQCSEKTDVYAFGVFLLELLSGKDVFSLTSELEDSETLLRDWVASLVREKRLESVLDNELLDLDDLDMNEVEAMVQVALLCMQPDPNERPTMEQVAKMLVGKGLAERWAQWQDEAGQVTRDDVMQIINTPALWENTTTGITLDGFEAIGPR